MRLSAYVMFFLGAGLLLMRPAGAGRPMTTDDAAITPQGECSAQAWIQRDRQASQAWFLPACTFLPDMELTAGGAVGGGNDSARTVSTQLKWLLRPEAPGELAWAASFGWTHLDATGHADHLNTRSLNLMASWLARDESGLLHLNVGMRDASDSVAHASWGIAYERAPEARLGAFVEAFGERGEAPTVQAGMRYDLVPQRFSLSLTVGARCDGGLREPFVTFGFNL